MGKALQHFITNQYDQALARMEQLLGHERTIENSYNLAGFYVNEEEDILRAKPLLEEAITQQPQHEFPYALVICIGYTS